MTIMIKSKFFKIYTVLYKSVSDIKFKKFYFINNYFSHIDSVAFLPFSLFVTHIK